MKTYRYLQEYIDKKRRSLNMVNVVPGIVFILVLIDFSKEVHVGVVLLCIVLLLFSEGYLQFLTGKLVERWRSYELIIDNQFIIKRQKPILKVILKKSSDESDDVRILRKEIGILREIQDGILIRTTTKVIHIPRQIDGYDEVKSKLGLG